MRILIINLLILMGLGISTVAFADERYQPLVGVPGLSSAGNFTTEDYVKALYMLSITVAGLLAVVKIIFAGVKYMLTDVVTSKSDAIKDIRGALLGLLIVLGAVLILQTINPTLLKLNIFGNAGAPESVTQQSNQTASNAPGTPSAPACLLPSDCTADEQYLKTTNSECGQCVPTAAGNDPTAQAQVFNYNTVRPDPTSGTYRIDTATLDKLDQNQVLSQFETGCVIAGLGSGVTPYPKTDPTDSNYTVYSCQ